LDSIISTTVRSGARVRCTTHIEELVLVVVLVPVELALQHAEPQHRIIHGAQRLVEPLLLGRAL
jgi:hypothetical protein